MCFYSLLHGNHRPPCVTYTLWALLGAKRCTQQRKCHCWFLIDAVVAVVCVLLGVLVLH